ncbi:MAG: heavy metal-associated domain-containing protein [Spirochaetales bacterium]
MKIITLKVEGMSCHHCVQTVKRTLQEISGVKKVEVTLVPPKAIVSGDDTLEASSLIHSLQNNTDYRATLEAE